MVTENILQESSSLHQVFKAEGNLAFKAKDYAAAAAAYQKAIDVADKEDVNFMSVLLTNLAMAEYHMGEYQSCLHHCESALNLDATNIKARYRALLAALILNNGALALRHSSALAQQPKNQTEQVQPVAEAVSHSLYNELHVRAAALAQHQALVGRVVAAPRPPASDATTEHADNESCAVNAVHNALRILQEDIDGEADADVATALDQLYTHLAGFPVAAAAFEGLHGYPLLLYHATEAHTAHVIQILEAAGGSNFLLPPLVWQRLVQVVVSPSSNYSVREQCLRFLVGAACGEPWVQHHLLTSPMTQNPTTVPVIALIDLLKRHEKVELSPTAAEHVAALLGGYASDPAAVQALMSLECQPLLALINLVTSAHDISSNSQATRTAPPPGLSPSEKEAWEQLRVKQQTVFDSDATTLQKTALTALKALCTSNAVVLAESVRRRVSTGGKMGTVEGPFLPALLACLREMHSQSPKRTAPVLGPDGQPRTYSKRPFAADYKDNPAGDFIATLDLNNQSILHEPSASAGSGGGGLGLSKVSQVGATVLELGLEVLLRVTQHGGHVTVLLYKHDVLGLCEGFFAYLTDSVVDLAAQILAVVSDSYQTACTDALSSGSIPSLAALLQFSTKVSTVAAALDHLAAKIDTCSGDDFAYLTRCIQHGALHKAYELAEQETTKSHIKGSEVNESQVQEAALRFLRLCTERAQRAQQLPRHIMPYGGVWDAIGKKKLMHILQIEPAIKHSASSPATGSEDHAGLSQLRRGFLGTNKNKNKVSTHSSKGAATSSPKQAPMKAESLSTTSTTSVTHYSNGVTIEELGNDSPADVDHKDHPLPGAPPSSTPRATTPTSKDHSSPTMKVTGPSYAGCGDEKADEEEEDVADLIDVYDSSKTQDQAQRHIRTVWMQVPLADKVRWTQTSSDISAFVALPPGTGAHEVQVDVTSTHLTVRLGWYGIVLDGELHRTVKATESQWCMEDNEVHILLPKGEGTQVWWKALFEGGEEKGYYDLLKEAVDADEPVTPYDEMEPGAKDLLESILERQAYINAGLIDPEGFDDFRVVIGENSLGGTSKQS